MSITPPKDELIRFTNYCSIGFYRFQTSIPLISEDLVCIQQTDSVNQQNLSILMV